MRLSCVSVALLAPSLAAAAAGDELNDGQAFILSAIGAAPAYAEWVGPHLGVGPAWSSSDLFESVDPRLSLPRSYAPTLAFGGMGTGIGTFSAEAEFNAGGRAREIDGFTTASPPMFWASYWAGTNPVSLFVDDSPVGIGPAAYLHAGLQGWLRMGIDKVGDLRVMELAHMNLGYGGFAYVRLPFAVVMGSAGWMPGFNSYLTMGKFDGGGRFAPGDPDIFVPIERYGEIMAGLIEAENHFRYDRSYVYNARLMVGPVSLSYQQRIVFYAPKPGSGLDADLGFHLSTHVVSVGIGGPSLGSGS